MVSLSRWIRQAISKASNLGRPALLLIVSDTSLQGTRYAFVLYLGYESLSLLGSFLFGAALGALSAVVVDFGINQHWLRLQSSDPALARSSFIRVLLAKTGLSVLGMVMIIGLAGQDWFPVTAIPAMAAGLFLTMVQGLAEACEAMFLAHHRYRLVALFRILLSLAMYGLPLALGLALTAQHGDAGIYGVLKAASIAGVALFCSYAWFVAGSLPSKPSSATGYRHAWWDARWLGVNQTAIVVDVRAPLVILGIMLGETAVGLYGLVQRTTAIVELAWASLSKLLLKSYADTASAGGTADVRVRMLAAGKMTGLIMVCVTVSAWVVTLYLAQVMELSEETSVALSLLRWALVAITLSSLKRPLVAGLLALYQERVVSRINLLSAVAGLVLIPLLVMWFGIWGPVIGWILLEGAACLLLIRHFLSIPSTPRSNLGGPVPQRAGI
jgi:O-antigen/teichoic acid export membrane protein